MKERLDVASVPPLALHDQCHSRARDSPQVRSNLDSSLTFLDLTSSKRDTAGGLQRASRPTNNHSDIGGQGNSRRAPGVQWSCTSQSGKMPLGHLDTPAELEQRSGGACTSGGGLPMIAMMQAADA